MILASQRIAHNLRDIRKSRSLSQAVLAKISGVPKSTINHIESAQSSPSIDVIEKLAQALGVSIEELLSVPAADVALVEPDELPVVRSLPGVGSIRRILPDPFPGVDIYVIDLEKGGLMPGITQGAHGRKMIFCSNGEIELRVHGASHKIRSGGAALFPGDQTHSFKNVFNGPVRLIKVHYYSNA